MRLILWRFVWKRKIKRKQRMSHQNWMGFSTDVYLWKGPKSNMHTPNMLYLYIYIKMTLIVFASNVTFSKQLCPPYPGQQIQCKEESAIIFCLYKGREVCLYLMITIIKIQKAIIVETYDLRFMWLTWWFDSQELHQNRGSQISQFESPLRRVRLCWPYGDLHTHTSFWQETEGLGR